LQQNQFNEPLCVEDLLTSQKILSSNYNTAVQEAANTALRRDLMGIQQQEQNAAYQVFSYMTQKGWYKVAPADPKMINETRMKVQQQIGRSGMPGSFGGMQPS
jgi:spore coat protein CotF